MKKSLLALSLIVLGGCNSIRQPAFVFNQEHGLEVPADLAYGESCIIRILGLVPINYMHGDYSVVEAAQMGGISKVIFADKVTTFHLVHSKSCIRVWGEKKKAPASDNQRQRDEEGQHAEE
jgi:hypothetical protein